MKRCRCAPWLAAALCLAFGGGPVAGADSEPAGDLAPRFRRFLEATAPFLTPAERDTFLTLAKDYQRQAFIEAFWRARDPFPETAANEARDRWELRLAEAEQRFGEAIDDRVRMMAIFGPPADDIPGRCVDVLVPLTIWRYRGSDLGGGDFALVFRESRVEGERRWRLWGPAEGMWRLFTGAGLTADPRALLEQVVGGCFRGEDVAAALAGALDWAALAERTGLYGAKHEWLATFLASSTDLPAGTETFSARLTVSFPGRTQSRTVVQALVAVPREGVAASAGEYPSYDFLVDGEVLRKGDLFEHFRYRFHLPRAEAEAGGEEIPLVLQRVLRPGVYDLVVRVQDLGSGRYFRVQSPLAVPAETEALAAALGTPAGGSPAADPVAEANAALAAAGDASIRMLPPPPGLQIAKTRVEAVVAGSGVARVRFLLNGQPVFTKAKPPYSVEVDLGPLPGIHRLAALALDEDGRELARDEVMINAGPHRFALRLVEPQRGGSYRESLRAHAQVEVPEGERLDRVEFFVNETLVATLYQAPFVQPMRIPPTGAMAYVRAVAHLADGATVEDLVYVNPPANLEMIDVQQVQLYTTVLDRQGRPVEGLGQDEFVVKDGGAEQRIESFELVRDQAIYAGLLLDNSSSMTEEIDEAVAGALRFFETVVTPRDRATVFTFNHRPELVVRFTSDPETLAAGVAGIRAEGGTALYDSLIYALYYFAGINGKRAIILLSDGEDEGSRYRFEDALEYARRTGVAVYTVAIGLSGKGAQTRMLLQRLAEETGGRSFQVERASELGRVYESIEVELRTQYLLTYPSPAVAGERGFREVAVEVRRPGVEAKTIRGYYP